MSDETTTNEAPPADPAPATWEEQKRHADMARMHTRLQAKSNIEPLYVLLAHADGELSAIAHGRPPSDKDELLRIAHGLREIYQGRTP